MSHILPDISPIATAHFALIASTLLLFATLKKICPILAFAGTLNKIAPGVI